MSEDISVKMSDDEIIAAVEAMPKEREFDISLLEKLQTTDNANIMAKMLLLNKTKKLADEPCHLCGLRYLCSQYIEGHNNNDRCVAGIAKELKKRFRWGDMFYEFEDKYEIDDILREHGADPLPGHGITKAGE